MDADIDYNTNMDAVDKIDMVLKSVECICKSLKWHKKYFFHMLDMVEWNTYCLYQSAAVTKLPFAKFHLTLIRQLLQKY